MSQVINSSKTEMSTSSLSETLGGMLTMRASIQMTKPAQCLRLPKDSLSQSSKSNQRSSSESTPEKS